MKKISSFILCTLIVCLLGACGSRTQTHGKVIEQANLNTLQLGASTREEVISNLGQPSFEGAFNSGKIYYNNQTMIRAVAGLNETTERTLFIFSFDDNNILQDIEIKDEKNDITIVKIDEKTPTPGENLGVLDQVFANLRKRSDQ